MLKRLAKRGGNKILLGWNRGLGDIALGLYAIVQRIQELVPQAEITFVTRDNLADGFSLLEGVRTIIDSSWRRGEAYQIDPDLKKRYDLVIEKPSPTDWVYWQRGKVVPKLKWDSKYDLLYERFDLPVGCIGAQVSAETGYGLWRNWPEEKWRELFDKLSDAPIVLFGFGDEPYFSHPNLIDLRGKTTLFELLSIIKHRIDTLIVPDSGISSMVYYLDQSFPLRHVTLWADPNQGILKQAVPSPNPKLVHRPLIAEHRNLKALGVDPVLNALRKKVLPILLAGGQGTRLGVQGPKGLFEIGKKTLFQWFCDKLPRGSSLAIMTSPLNHAETVAYFHKNHFFGLDIHFFQQEMIPIFDEQKQPTTEMGPSGNGSVFRSFVRAGLDKTFADTERVTINYVDNPLNRPLDEKLIQGKEDVVVQCIERTQEDLSMGVLVELEGKWQVVEYTELDPNQNYKYAYSGQIAFDFSFFCQMSNVELPIHWIYKKMAGKMVWKKETFLFDVFQYAKDIRLLCVEKQTHFAPIKGPKCVALLANVLERL